ncbi:PAS domain S-box protein, partial [Streptomyces sp. TRM76130]|nr:PAS domain S-box protein [Streptomyces sp. TRM76130]
MSEIPARATGSKEAEGASAGVRSGAAGKAAAAAGRGDVLPGDTIWQSSPPGSIYDYIKVASFSIGPDGLVDQWSLRAEQLFGVSAEQVRGTDPVDVFIDPDLRERGQRKMAEILDGREW